MQHLFLEFWVCFDFAQNQTKLPHVFTWVHVYRKHQGFISMSYQSWRRQWYLPETFDNTKYQRLDVLYVWKGVGYTIYLDALQFLPIETFAWYSFVNIVENKAIHNDSDDSVSQATHISMSAQKRTFFVGTDSQCKGIPKQLELQKVTKATRQQRVASRSHARSAQRAVFCGPRLNVFKLSKSRHAADTKRSKRSERRKEFTQIDLWRCVAGIWQNTKAMYNVMPTLIQVQPTCDGLSHSCT